MCYPEYPGRFRIPRMCAFALEFPQNNWMDLVLVQRCEVKTQSREGALEFVR